MNIQNIYPKAKAEQIASTLNDDPEDRWTYEVELLDGKAARARVCAFDEEGEFVGYV
jgi:hypothetical protein